MVFCVSALFVRALNNDNNSNSGYITRSIPAGDYSKNFRQHRTQVENPPNPRIGTRHKYEIGRVRKPTHTFPYQTLQKKLHTYYCMYFQFCV